MVVCLFGWFCGDHPQSEEKTTGPGKKDTDLAAPENRTAENQLAEKRRSSAEASFNFNLAGVSRPFVVDVVPLSGVLKPEERLKAGGFRGGPFRGGGGRRWFLGPPFFVLFWGHPFVFGLRGGVARFC